MIKTLLCITSKSNQLILIDKCFEQKTKLKAPSVDKKRMTVLSRFLIKVLRN